MLRSGRPIYGNFQTDFSAEITKEGNHGAGARRPVPVLSRELIELGVVAAARNKFAVRAALNNLAAVQHKDLVAVYVVERRWAIVIVVSSAETALICV